MFTYPVYSQLWKKVRCLALPTAAFHVCRDCRLLNIYAKLQRNWLFPQRITPRTLGLLKRIKKKSIQHQKTTHKSRQQHTLKWKWYTLKWYTLTVYLKWNDIILSAWHEQKGFVTLLMFTNKCKLCRLYNKGEKLLQ